MWLVDDGEREINTILFLIISREFIYLPSEDVLTTIIFTQRENAIRES